jgi:hypothetical protein
MMGGIFIKSLLSDREIRSLKTKQTKTSTNNNYSLHLMM